MRSPNFLIGGTAASGTSFLATTLVQNPQIYLPTRMRPEPHYFFKSWEYRKGFGNYLSAWFAEVPPSAIAVGERSSSYLYGGAKVAHRIRSALPSIRLIFVLRNPVQRAWANYRYTVLQGLEHLSFIDALEREGDRKASADGIWNEIQPHDYSGRSRYAAQLREYLTVFSANDILLLKSESLSAHTEHELGRVHDFLHVTAPSQGYTHEPAHHALGVECPQTQMQCRRYFGDRFDTIIEAIRREEDFSALLKTAADKEWAEILQNNLSNEGQRLSLDAQHFLREVLADDLESLDALVPFDISDWSKY